MGGFLLLKKEPGIEIPGFVNKKQNYECKNLCGKCEFYVYCFHSAGFYFLIIVIGLMTKHVCFATNPEPMPVNYDPPPMTYCPAPVDADCFATDYEPAPEDYCRAPTLYGPAPVSYELPPATYGLAPMNDGPAPMKYGKAPTNYGQPPTSQGKALLRARDYLSIACKGVRKDETKIRRKAR